MKKNFLILGLALLAAPNLAHAYSSPAAVDPINSISGFRGQEIETKSIVKSQTAGSSEALIAGLVVGYDATAKDGYTVTRAVPQTEVGQDTLACVTIESYASADSGYRPCITKGFALVRYDGSSDHPIIAGKHACVDAGGTVRGCRLGSAIEATANTGLIPLESKTDSGTQLRLMINLQ